MRIVADLHIHSRFSIATSPKLTAPNLDRWARIKGLDLVGTGDCTHPAWLKELRAFLEPAEDGLFRLGDRARREFDSGEALAEGLPDPGDTREVRFVLSGEISTIYSRDDKTRKVHHVVFLPGFEAAVRFQALLEREGNIASDGRPILGLDSRDLFSLLLDADDRSVLVPAHIWTPWFSALGGRSGFDSIEECYGDLAPRIGAVETGLSSNPPMNWAVSALDRFAIVSNSDAHSPEKLGREATVLDTDLSYRGLSNALSSGGAGKGVLETVEFFPQEGKYHYDGHRSCGVVRAPGETQNGLCPVCGKPLTPGVLRRVTELADRAVDERASCPERFEGTNRRPYRSLIPLKELLAELLGTGNGSHKVAAAYNALVQTSGSEFGLLLGKSLQEIAQLRAPGVSGELLAEAVGRMREGRVSIVPGYDGEYGVIRAFGPNEKIGTRPQKGLFGADIGAGGVTPRPRKTKNGSKKSLAPRTAAPTSIAVPVAVSPARVESSSESVFLPDPDQERAVTHPGGPALVLAGPGTGKTSVLSRRIARVLTEGAPPSCVLALTFTNKAAGELRERIARSAGEKDARSITASTFHAFCLSLLREHAEDAGLPSGFAVLAEEEREVFLDTALRDGEDEGSTSGAGARRLAEYIEARKRFLMLPGESRPRLGAGAPGDLEKTLEIVSPPAFDESMDGAYSRYRDALRAAEALDFDDLVSGAARLLSARPELLRATRDRYRFVFVDEYQDVNFAQYALIRILAPREIFVIGDPNQAIYAFRGSDRRFLERFCADYPETVVYRLSRSFRCAPAILDAAGRLTGTELRGTGKTVALWRSEAPTEKAEAEGIAREIDRMIGGTRFFALDSGVAQDAAYRTQDGSIDADSPNLRSLGECAVLVRAAVLARPIRKALLDHGIPCRIVGERPWWDEEPIRSLLRTLRRAARPATSAFPGNPAPRSRESSEASAEIEEALRAKIQGLSPERAVRTAAEFPPLAKRSGHGENRDAIERLLSFAANYGTLASFLDALTLGSPQDGPRENDREVVTVTTIHAAKGLEFDHVFVAGLEDGLLPFTLFDRDGEASSEEHVEEERRLLYVAVTRARIGLHLYRARSRVFLGRKLTLPPSRFLAEIEDLIPLKEEPLRARHDPQPELF